MERPSVQTIIDSGGLLGMQPQQISTTDHCHYNMQNIQISLTIMDLQSNTLIENK